MNHFSDLIHPQPEASAKAQQDRADEQLLELADAHGFALWRPGEPIPALGQRLLIGVATYSAQDMSLLDDVWNWLARLEKDKPIVHLFNTRDVQSMKDFEHFIPSVAPVYQTPVVGLWQDGALVAQQSGAKGRKLVCTLIEKQPPIISVQELSEPGRVPACLPEPAPSLRR